MTLANIKRRVGALETVMMPSRLQTVHLLGRTAGQSQEEAVATYEATNGPIGDQDGVITLVGLKSKQSHD